MDKMHCAAEVERQQIYHLIKVRISLSFLSFVDVNNDW